MKTFYSILSVPTRPTVNEQVSIALFVKQGEEVFFQFSASKLKVVKQLIPESAFNLLNSYLKNIEKSIGAQVYSNGSLDLVSNLDGKELNESYFEYLAKYSNNLISFSRPQAIDIDMSSEMGNRLFEKFIFDLEETPIEKEPTTYQKVKRTLFPKIKGTVNLDYRLTNDLIPELMTPSEVNIIGRNGLPVAAQTFEFDLRAYNLESNLAHYVTVIKALELNTGQKGKFFAIGTEPSKRDFPKQHRTWSIINKSSFMEYVPLSETEKIESYIDSKGVQPFFDLQD